MLFLFGRQASKETDSFFLAPYKLIDSQTEIINIYSPYLYSIDSIDYSQKLYSHLQFFPFTNDYFLYKKGDNNTDSIFAMVGDDGSLAPIIMCNLGYRVLGELKELLSQTDIKHEAIFLLYPTFLHFFVLKNNEVYIFADGKLEKAVSYFQQRYSIEKFRQMLTCQCDPDRPIQKGRTVTPEEIEKLKK